MFCRLEEEKQGNQLEEILWRLNPLNIGTYKRSCREAAPASSGIFMIRIPGYSNQPFKVVCEETDHGSGWTVILRRQDGSVDFYRNWNDYKNGFGNLNGEFFLGFDKIHALTADQSQQLLVLLEDGDGQKRYEKYDRFAVGDELESYALHTLGKAEGSAGDSLRKHLGLRFSTYDKSNGVDPRNCAVLYTGAWWYQRCHDRFA